jgi:DNA processing protein
MAVMEPLTYWLALKTVPGVGNRLFLQLLKHFGEPRGVFEASRDELLKVEGISRRLVSIITDYKIPAAVRKDLALVHEKGFKIVTFSDPDYPQLLREIHDPPPLLYVHGRLRPGSLNIAIVGSRHPTPYGRTVTQQLSAGLVQRGFTVVSGMARGIDSAAHAGALAGKGETIAVLGSGLGIIYPAENKKLFHRIAERGAVVSEFPVLTPPEAHNFPIRNRIISGLALGAVIVEATQKSGSLITARLAAEQGREVFAVPGSVSSFKSMGTHGLIKEGAKLVENVNDIIEELNVVQPTTPTIAIERPAVALTDAEEAILGKLSPYPIHIDRLIQQLPLSTGEVSGILLGLELKGLVTQTPGKCFARSEPESH